MLTPLAWHLRTFLLAACGIPLAADPRFLTMPLDPMGMGAANAMTASATGAAAMRYNPAGLGFTDHSQVQLNHLVLNDFFTANTAMASYAFSPDFSAGVFLSALYLNQPFTQRTDFIDGGNLSYNDAELGVSLGYALNPRFSVGGNIRYFRMQLGPQLSQNMGADLGAMYRFNLWDKGYERFRAGVYFKNLGPSYDFYSGGTSLPQPWVIRAGLAYDLQPWVQSEINIQSSFYEGLAYMMGFRFDTGYYLSPRLGVMQDFSGTTFTFGGAMAYGDVQKFVAYAGAGIGPYNAGQNYQFSLSLQQPLASAGTTEVVRNSSFDEIELKYEPYRITEHNPPYRAEKLQGIVVSSVESSGYLERKYKLRRVALQPEDDPYLKTMAESGRRTLYLTHRRMGLWFRMPDSARSEDYLGWWEAFSAGVNDRVDVMIGNNLDSLNSNPNAPLRVEWRLDITPVPETKEIRTRLTELYSGSTVLVRNFPILTTEGEAWQTLCDFYADYFRNQESFYTLRMGEMAK